MAQIQHCNDKQLIFFSSGAWTQELSYHIHVFHLDVGVSIKQLSHPAQLVLRALKVQPLSSLWLLGRGL